MSAETMVAIALSVGVGVAATATMDVLGSVARRWNLTAGVPGGWVGRWYLGVVQGQLAHANIAAVPERAGEQRVAMIGHYSIGIALAVL